MQPDDGAHDNDTIRSPHPVSSASALTPPSFFGSQAHHRQSHVADALVAPSPAPQKRKQQHDPPQHDHQEQQHPSPHQPKHKQKRRSSMAHVSEGGGGHDSGGGGGGAGPRGNHLTGHKASTTVTTTSSSNSDGGGGRGGRGLSMRDAVARTCLNSLLETAEVRTWGLGGEGGGSNDGEGAWVNGGDAYRPRDGQKRR